MNANLATLLYLVAGLLFVPALRGQPGPGGSRMGDRSGMIGMAVAIVTTLAYARPVGVSAWLLIAIGLAIGGGLGAALARRGEKTGALKLAAFFQSLIGLAAVLVAAGALFAPKALGIGAADAIPGAHLVEMALGAAFGGIVCGGSLVAFLKLDGRMSGATIQPSPRRLLKIALVAALTALMALFLKTQSHQVLFLIALVSCLIGVVLVLPIAGAEMPAAIAMLNSSSGWAAAGIGFVFGNLALIIAGALVGSSSAMASRDKRGKDASAAP